MISELLPVLQVLTNKVWIITLPHQWSTTLEVNKKRFRMVQQAGTGLDTQQSSCNQALVWSIKPSIIVQLYFDYCIYLNYHKMYAVNHLPVKHIAARTDPRSMRFFGQSVTITNNTKLFEVYKTFNIGCDNTTGKCSICRCLLPSKQRFSNACLVHSVLTQIIIIRRDCLIKCPWRGNL